MLTEKSACREARRPGMASRVVVKIGSALLAGEGRLSPARIQQIVDDVAAVRSRSCEVILVVSGAVAAGYQALGLTGPPRDVVKRQAAASIGQPLLMAALTRAFEPHRIPVAQLLLTAEDIENRRRFLSARHTLQLLLDRGIVPVVNENDALSEDEKKVGDNDHLAALVALLSSARTLVLLSQVEGVLQDGGKGPRIREVDDPQLVHRHLHAGTSRTGVGGMAAKVSAARLAAEYGVVTVIADGRVPGLLAGVLRGDDVGTRFLGSSRDAVRRWIDFRSRTRGALRVSDRALGRIRDGAGGVGPEDVLGVEGDFLMGSRVEIRSSDEVTVAVGLASYSAREIRLMRGRDATRFEPVLGFRYVEEIVQGDDLVSTEGKESG